MKLRMSVYINLISRTQIKKSKNTYIIFNINILQVFFKN
jgi:hypothetical protein